MAKYTASIDEDTRQRILALPKGVRFTLFMRKAIIAFLDELEKDSNLIPDDFVITLASNAPDRKRG